jgi:hypothetical protein
MNDIDEALAKAQRVTTFLQKPSFFTGTYESSRVIAEIVRDPARALEYANKLNYDDESYEDYVELLETEKAKVKRGIPPGLEAKISDFIFGNADRSATQRGILRTDLLDSSLSKEERQVLDANFDYEIVGCAINLNSSKPSKLFDHILCAFESGGIPCGWMGKFPRGELIVFLPESVHFDR